MMHFLYLLIFLLSAALLPSAVLAHEQQVFNVANTELRFLIGFRSEFPYPIVGRKTALEVMVINEKTFPRRQNIPLENATFRTDIESRFKVEARTDGIVEELELVQSIEDNRVYWAHFVPTFAGPYSFRLFGAIDRNPIDIISTCTVAADHDEADKKNPPKVVSEPLPPPSTVVRVFRSGGFPCPQPQGAGANLEIPPDTKIKLELATDIRSILQTSEKIGQKFHELRIQLRTIERILLGILAAIILVLGIAGISRLRRWGGGQKYY